MCVASGSRVVTRAPHSLPAARMHIQICVPYTLKGLNENLFQFTLGPNAHTAQSEPSLGRR